ncbi:GTPase Era [Lachnoanaerobaculum sp. Marseille-Q4761]|uniref:GTPase Era n=1 Tax=Lachnoanaerobaculum sp. Marseille-Q4761 TaxID=2819511 RepID=UPI000F18F28E|nr:GTPase Era [Lachnoanaerobaculum sp. Marseille-Q4761]MBO1869434.1 GTPase Era [Lachnoanaerobaculum sp. Marseille-Q4761]RKW46436.1 MAG: GTPase Era [Lachnospiraceae bacterium]
MKSGFVALIGRPNVGKSTLMNTLIGQKIAITSNKPQTTRNRIQTVFTDERGQIVFLDTPGIHKAKNKLGEYMVKVSTRTLRDVDMVLWLIEPNTFIGEGDEHIFEILSNVEVPVILAINKMDSLKQKEDMLAVIAKYSSKMKFAEVVPVSALKGTNTDKLLEIIFKYLSEGPMYYDEDTVTDQPIKQIAAELIREKALRFLQEEIPHGIAVEIDTFSYRDSGDMVDIEAAIVCEKDSHKGIIIGKAGSMLKRIGTAARKDIEGLLEARVNLKLWVKVRPKWRDSDVQMKNFGYNPKDL